MKLLGGKFETRRIAPINPGDERGPIYEIVSSELGFEPKQVSFCMRKKQCKFGDHFHTGSDPSKNPEIFFLAHGSMRWSAKYANESFEDIGFESGRLFLIQPYVLHSALALTDVVFAELRKTEFDHVPVSTDEGKWKRMDTYPVHKYGFMLAEYLKTRP